LGTDETAVLTVYLLLPSATPDAIDAAIAFNDGAGGTLITPVELPGRATLQWPADGSSSNLRGVARSSAKGTGPKRCRENCMFAEAVPRCNATCVLASGTVQSVPSGVSNSPLRNEYHG